MLLKKKNLSLLLIEKEKALAAHQTGNNSGVIHSGLYYKPGSYKAENCVRGRTMLYDFCGQHGIPFERCGKVVVATTKDELPQLEELERKGLANGLKGMRRISGVELLEYEPHVRGYQALHIPETGIVDYEAVTAKYAELSRERGAEIVTDCEFLSLSRREHLTLETTQGSFETSLLINCAGLHSDRVARLCYIEPEVMIVPFRGEYYELRKEKHYLVNNLIYPVPDPRFPFLGVHFTRMIGGGREAGPNAVLAGKREGYSWSKLSPRDVSELVFYPGFFQMAKKYFRMGFAEMYRSMNKAAFVRSMQALIPAITGDDVVRGGAGVRAQALDRHGKLLDDFCIRETRGMIHVLNAPSPAATASLSIGDTISGLALKQL
jgi:L-2-hydroxyglutarate oxidase